MTEYSETYKSNNNYSNHSAGRYVFEQDANHLIHYSTSGSVLWQKEFDSTVKIQTVACNENLVVLGINLKRTAFPANLHFVVYDHDGVLQWEYSFERDDGSGWNAMGAYVDSNDNVYAAYQYGGSRGGGHLMKLDDSGSLLWNRAFDSSTLTQCHFNHIAKSPNGNLFVTGEAAVSGSSVETFLLKIDDSNGSVVWSKRYYTGANDTNGWEKVGSIDATDAQITIATSTRAMQNGTWAYLPQILRIDPSNGDLTSSVSVSSESSPYYPANPPAPSMVRAQDGGLLVSCTGRYTSLENVLVVKFSSDTNLTKEWAIEISGGNVLASGLSGAEISEFGSNIIIHHRSYEISLPSDGSAVNGTAGELSIRPVPLVRPATSTTDIDTPAWSATNPSTYVVVGSTSITSTTGNETSVDNKSPASAESDGLVWIKIRTNDSHHILTDTQRGPALSLWSDESNYERVEPTHLISFNANGFTLGVGSEVNTSGHDYVSWTFRKAPSFFDVVTYMGDGVTGREIPHSLGVAPGMMIIKRTDTNGYSWQVYHRGLPSALYRLELDNSNGQSTSLNPWDGTAPTNSVFTVNDSAFVNESNAEYVAYLFAHDDSGESLIKCGSYTGNGNANGPIIDLGFEPQWLLIKNASGDRDWVILDSMRGIVTGGNDKRLHPNLTDSESGDTLLDLTSTGFQLTYTGDQVNGSGDEYIYMAIRRPNKPAEEFEADELFAIAAGSTAEPAYTSGFPVDMEFIRNPTLAGGSPEISSRVTGNEIMRTNSDIVGAPEVKTSFDYMNGWRDQDNLAVDYLSWMWRRAPGFFDVVTYEGSDDQMIVDHNLGVKPEMIWSKRRNDVRNWCVILPSIAYLGDYSQLWLNLNNAVYDRSYSSTNYMTQDVTDTQIFYAGNSGGGNADLNYIGDEYINYLWASVSGICDIGSYTGTGGSIDIDCGFTNGARWVLIKRTDEAGDWAITTNNGLSVMINLNDTGAQIGYYAISPIPIGFNVTAGNQAGASFANQTGAEYIYMAIA